MALDVNFEQHGLPGAKELFAQALRIEHQRFDAIADATREARIVAERSMGHFVSEKVSSSNLDAQTDEAKYFCDVMDQLRIMSPQVNQSLDDTSIGTEACPIEDKSAFDAHHFIGALVIAARACEKTLVGTFYNQMITATPESNADELIEQYHEKYRESLFVMPEFIDMAEVK